jgi:hypothetical protein
MSVAHYLLEARFAAKPLATKALVAKFAETWEKLTSRVQAPNGDVLVNIAFGAVAIYGATMVVSLLTL